MINRDSIPLFIFHTQKAISSFINNEIFTANLHLNQAKEYIDRVNIDQIRESYFCFYDSLVAIAMIDNNETDWLSQQEKVEANQNQLLQFNQDFDHNYLSQWQLVEAEKYRIIDQKLEAIELYDNAIATAKEKEDFLIEALANELAAKFYLAWGKTKIAKVYLKEAYDYYHSQGLIAKIVYLAQYYSELLNPSINHFLDSEDGCYIPTDISPVGIYHCDAQGQCIYANSKTRELKGLTLKEILNDGWTKRLHPDDRLPVYNSWLSFVKQSKLNLNLEFKQEMRFIHPEKGLVWIYSQAMAQRNEKGEVTGFIGISVDITDVKELEIVQQTSANKLEDILDNSAAVISCFHLYPDLSWQYQYYSEGSKSIFGYSHSELLADQKLWLSRIIPEDIENTIFPSLKSTQEKRISTGNLVFRFRHKDNSIRWISESFTARQHLEQDCLIVTTISIDITAKKQAEEALKHSEAKLRSILENAPNYIIQVDRQHNILFINRLGEGYTLESVIGHSVEEFTLPQSHEIQAEAIAQVFDTGKTQTVEIEALGDNQVKAVYETKFVPVIKNQQVESVIIMATDITARKQAQATIENLVIDTSSVTGENFFPVLAQQIAQTLQISDVLVSRKNNQQLETLSWYSNGEIKDNCVYPICHSPCETTIEQSSHYCIQNVQQQYPQDRELKDMNAESYMGVALKNKTGEVIGVLCIFDRQPLPKNYLFIQNILKIFGTRAAAELERLEVEEALRNLNQELEERINRRTLALASSQKDLRTIFNSVDEAIFIHDWQGNILDVNARGLELFTTTKKQISQMTFVQLLQPPFTEKQLSDNYQKLKQGENLNLEWQAKRPYDNFIFEVEVSLKKITINNIDIVLAVVRDITKQKQAKVQLQESRNMLKLVLDTIPQRVFWKDLNLKYLGCNSTFAQDTNLTCEEIIGKSDFDCIWKNWAQRYEDDDAIVINSLIPKLNYEEPTFINNDQKRWVRTSKIPLTNSQNEVIGVLGCYEDITEQKQIEEKLKENQRRLRFALEGSENGVWDWNIEQKTVFYSPQWKKMLGYEVDEIEHTFEQWESLLHPEDKDSCSRLINQHLDGITSIYINEHRLRCKDGSYKWIMARGKILEWTDDGKPLRTFGTHTDISDRKLAEEKLIEAQRFSQRITENTPNIIYIYDLVENRNIYCNRELFQILGYSPEEVQNMGSQLFEFLIHPDDLQRLIQYQQQILKLKNHEVCEIEYRIRHADGSWRYLLDHVSVFRRDQNGLVIQYIGSSQDITERKQTELLLKQVNLELEARVKQRTIELEKAKEKAESANQAKTSFLANMSHELRTPLNGIMGYAQILQTSNYILVEDKKNIQLIYQCGSHLLNLIEDILDISAIEVGKMQLYPQEFFLPSLLKEVVVVCQLKAQNKNLELIYTPNPLIPKIIIQDQRRLKQVLLNLLSNAIKFTRQGKITLKIDFKPDLLLNKKLNQEISLTANSGMLYFEVKDTGIGLSTEQLKTIFLPFEQVGSVEQKSHGTGLGLSICQNILKLMNSELKVESSLGKGSTFSFTLPVATSNQQSQNIYSILPSNIIGYEGQKKKILIVDDRINNRKILEQILQPIGFIVKEASDGIEGLEKVVYFEPDLIILDLVMPNMDGWKMLEHLRQMPQGKDTQVIIYTANVANKQELERSTLLDCCAFISKPVNIATLLNQVSQALNLSWIYDTSSAIEENDLSENTIIDFPPQDILVKLYDISKQGRLSSLIKEVKKLTKSDIKYQAFANHLQYLAEEMEFKEIEQFLSRQITQ